MTSTDLQESVLSDYKKLEKVGESFTRPRSYDVDLECLQDIAFRLFNDRRKEISDLEIDVRELNKLVEKIALVIGKTYVERGDSYNLADDEALTLIRDLLLHYHPHIIKWNRNKRLLKDLFQ